MTTLDGTPPQATHYSSGFHYKIGLHGLVYRHQNGGWYSTTKSVEDLKGKEIKKVKLC